ncbi:hypothetical protein [Spirosoma flavum]|uniref:DNA binding HTH domain-containing protein n=1 Tax=Spirosoma flavum TaxID=2048557 RepID=A0ABW6ALC7_9BACT
MVKRRVFDRTGGPEAFKEMAVELSYAKGSIQEAARELDIDPGRANQQMEATAQKKRSNIACQYYTY